MKNRNELLLNGWLIQATDRAFDFFGLVIYSNGTGGPISGVLIGAAAPIAIAIEFPPGFMSGVALIFQLPVIQIFPD
jgi:hypothetical protein